MISLIVLSSAAASCPVCFGATESSKTNDSVNMAVLVLLGVTGVLLSLFGAFFAYLRRRMKITLEGTFDYPNLN
ncbi:MAG: hypothetical protein HYY49_14640 [Ignavibacteriales bacterium]|nr:hypothetical protein [Ignavibacteriales bacterium]